MPEFYTHDELATEEGFIAVVRRLPKPIPPDLRPVYYRLRQFGLRRGWAWPYRNYIPEDKRASSTAVAPPAPVAIPAGAPTDRPIDRDTPSVGHWKFTERYEYWIDNENHVRRALRETPLDRLGQRWPAEWLGARDTYEPAHNERIANPPPPGQSHGHLCFKWGQEVYQGHHGSYYRAPITAGFDDDYFRLEFTSLDRDERAELGLPVAGYSAGPRAAVPRITVGKYTIDEDMLDPD